MRCAAVLVGLLAASRSPLPNPTFSEIEAREVAAVRIADAESREETVVAAPEPLLLADSADRGWAQPIQFDPTGGRWANSTSSAVHSPLWIPRARPADGSWPVPPGRQDRERIAAALVISLALILSSIVK